MQHTWRMKDTDSPKALGIRISTCFIWGFQRTIALFTKHLNGGEEAADSLQWARFVLDEGHGHGLESQLSDQDFPCSYFYQHHHQHAKVTTSVLPGEVLSLGCQLKPVPKPTSRFSCGALPPTMRFQINLSDWGGPWDEHSAKAAALSQEMLHAA